MHHGTCVTHVPWCMPGSLTGGFLWCGWRGKHSRRMRNPQFYVSGKRPIVCDNLLPEVATLYRCILSWYNGIFNVLTHLPLDKMAGISQTIFSNAFLWMKRFAFWFEFHWSLFPRVQLTSIASDNGLAPNRQQAIICTNADPIHLRIFATLWVDELTDGVYCAKTFTECVTPWCLFWCIPFSRFAHMVWLSQNFVWAFHIII